VGVRSEVEAQVKLNIPLYSYDTAQDQDLPVVHMAHANGFPPGVYRELVGHLMGNFRTVSIPFRPLWEPAPPPEEFQRWQEMGDDLIAGFEAHGLSNVIGIGHSLGGVATLMAAVKRPDLFKALILLDPVLFPRFIVWLFAGLPSWLPRPTFPLVNKALRRRRQWDSQQDAFDRFHGRSLFAAWSDETLWAYVKELTVPINDGEGVELQYTPEWEARIYETSAASVKGWWRWIKDLKTPTLAVQGGDTDTFMDSSVRLWKKERPDLPVISIAEGKHLFPVDLPAITAQHIQPFLDEHL
jgi:pimeloyl-ACP methyl ester carboxylesterase